MPQTAMRRDHAVRWQHLFQLKEMPGGRTRLVVSGYAVGRPRLLFALSNLLFWEPAHWIMQTRQLANLKQRAEEEFERQTAIAVQPASSIAAPW